MIRLADLALGCVCAVLFATGPASAYDAEAGRRKAEEACTPCHGPNGNSEQPAVPSLAGQTNDYVVLALYQFRAKHRPSGAMEPAAAPLTDTDLGNLAAYYSKQTPWKRSREASPEALATGPAILQQKHCIQCHTANLAGQDSIPRTAGQKADFLTTQLRLFKAGVRGDIDGNMTSAAQDLTETDIAVLADYISGLSTP